jgi:hypothetical protein
MDSIVASLEQGIATSNEKEQPKLENVEVYSF